MDAVSKVTNKGQGLATEEENLISVKDLLECGAHFGHQTQRWNPKMKRYIFEERNGIYIIDLAKTIQQIRKAVDVVRGVVGKRKSILFVGTKKQAKSVIKEFAEECREFYICERWLGGTLTNLMTIRQSVKTLEELEKTLTERASGFTKKETILMNKEKSKLERNLSGIRSMRKPPGLLIVVDPSHEHIAVAEANKLGIPVMALVDTNCDPDPIDHVIACNDDALKSIKLILQALKNAILDKKQEMNVLLAKGTDLQELSKENEENSDIAQEVEEERGKND